jgi:hypothetical protein
MSDNVNNIGFDALVELDLSKVKSKLRRKIFKQIIKENFEVIINVDVYGGEESLIDISTDAVAILKSKKRKKNKK